MNVRHVTRWALMAAAVAAASCSNDETEPALVPPSQRTWSPAERIEEASLAYTMKVAVNQTGDAVVAWDQLDGKVMGKLYDAQSGAWRGAQALDREDHPLDSVFPSVAIDPGGNALVAWHRQSSRLDSFSVWTNRFDGASGTWSSAQEVAASQGGGMPQVAVDGGGHSLLVFSKLDETASTVLSARSEPTTSGWSTAEVLHPIPDTHAGGVQVAMEPDGDAVAMWISRTLTSFKVWAARFAASTGSWSEVQPISLEVESAHATDLAVNEAGQAFAIWVQSAGEDISAWSSRSEGPGMPWSPAARVDAPGLGLALLPELVIDGKGNAVAAWSAEDPEGGQSVWANRYDAAAGGWQTPQAVESEEADAFVVRLGSDRDGNVLAIWTRDDDVRMTPWVSWFDAATLTWGAPHPLESEGTGDSTFGQVAVTPDGRAVAVWVNDTSSILVSHCR